MILSLAIIIITSDLRVTRAGRPRPARASSVQLRGNLERIGAMQQTRHLSAMPGGGREGAGRGAHPAGPEPVPRGKASVVSILGWGGVVAHHLAIDAVAELVHVDGDVGTRTNRSTKKPLAFSEISSSPCIRPSASPNLR